MSRSKKRPRLFRPFPTVLVVVALLAVYAGLIYLALRHYTNNAAFLCLLGAMVLLPPLLTGLLLRAFSGHFRAFWQEVEPPEEDDAASPPPKDGAPPV